MTNEGETYQPLIEEGVTWETDRMGTPGKLTFKVLADGIVNFQEGNNVVFSVDDTMIFNGFVFTKKRDKNQIITVTAYDQLRYLKNKDTMVYRNKKASEVIQKLAADFVLQAGDIEDTGFVIPVRVEENTTLMDVIQTALHLTTQHSGNVYVLYDDIGKITLRNIESMKLNVVIGEGSAENFNYSSSIDKDTYNRIKLSQKNEEKGRTEIFIVEDKVKQNEWGLLQYYEEIDSDENGIVKVEALNKLHNQKRRSLSIQHAIGDIRVRGGSSVIIHLPKLGDISLQNYMLVDKVKHTFKDSQHVMDLTLRGGLIRG